MNGEMTVREAGRRGGLALLAKRGPGYFAALARRASRREPAYYRHIGRKGGRANARRYEQEAAG